MKLNFRPRSCQLSLRLSLSSLLNQRCAHRYTFLTENACYYFASSCLHILTRVANSGTDTIVLRDATVLVFGHTSTKHLKEKVSTRNVTREQRSNTMIGVPKAVNCSFRTYMPRMLILGHPSSGRLMSLCCRIVPHKMLYLIVFL